MVTIFWYKAHNKSINYAPSASERLRVIDWEHPANNDFLLVSQFSVTGALYTCRACPRARRSTRT